MPDRERKSISIELKAESEGSFRAVFSTFGVIDRDGDVTVAGAFQKGQEVRIAQWGHNWGALPVGKGAIDADDAAAWVDGAFFLDTGHGKDTYQTVKNLGELQEWSYGFEVKKYSFGEFDGREVRFLEQVEVFEVSPVMLGAGIGTHTESIKGSTYEQQADMALAAMKDLLERDMALAALRAKDGRRLPQKHLDALAEMREGIDRLMEPPKDALDLAKEFARFQAIRARALGVAV